MSHCTEVSFNHLNSIKSSKMKNLGLLFLVLFALIVSVDNCTYIWIIFLNQIFYFPQAVSYSKPEPEPEAIAEAEAEALGKFYSLYFIMDDKDLFGVVSSIGSVYSMHTDLWSKGGKAKFFEQTKKCEKAILDFLSN